jgi:hypothetical protein
MSETTPTINTFSTLDNLFGTSTTVVESKTNVVDNTTLVALPEITTADRDEEDDVQFARQNLRELTRKADIAIDELTDLARQSEAPRMYEVLATMLNSAAAASKQLVDMHKQRSKTQTANPQGSATNVTNQQNIVFTGSPSELLRNLKALNEQPK